MNEKNEQKDENEQDSMVDLEPTLEQADQARAGDGQLSQPEYKYVTVRPYV